MELCKELRETAGDAGNGLDRESRAAIDDAVDEIERLRAALKDIQAKAVGINPPRHTWYYDRAEEALAPHSDAAGQPPR